MLDCHDLWQACKSLVAAVKYVRKHSAKAEGPANNSWQKINVATFKYWHHVSTLQKYWQRVSTLQTCATCRQIVCITDLDVFTKVCYCLLDMVSDGDTCVLDELLLKQRFL